LIKDFLYNDFINKPAYSDFFDTGNSFNSRFSYEVSFGFMPREFNDSPEDRYIYEEEGDVTEIYFLIKGQWAVAFDSFCKYDADEVDLSELGRLKGTPDMSKKGILVAMSKRNCAFIGDYYVLASKRAQFYYVALSRLHSYALTKQFLHKHLFKKFP
jgi:hypothetical protein